MRLSHFASPCVLSGLLCVLFKLNHQIGGFWYNKFVRGCLDATGGHEFLEVSGYPKTAKNRFSRIVLQLSPSTVQQIVRMAAAIPTLSTKGSTPPVRVPIETWWAPLWAAMLSHPVCYFPYPTHLFDCPTRVPSQAGEDAYLGHFRVLARYSSGDAFHERNHSSDIARLSVLHVRTVSIALQREFACQSRVDLAAYLRILLVLYPDTRDLMSRELRNPDAFFNTLRDEFLNVAARLPGLAAEASTRAQASSDLLSAFSGPLSERSDSSKRVDQVCVCSLTVRFSVAFVFFFSSFFFFFFSRSSFAGWFLVCDQEQITVCVCALF